MEELRLNDLYQVAWAERDEVAPQRGNKEPTTTPTRRKRTQFDVPRKPGETLTDDSTPPPPTSTLTLASHELIVVTHTGDWFRLGVPDGTVEQGADDSDGELGERARREPETGGAGVIVERADRCKVLEYRRLRTAAVEW